MTTEPLRDRRGPLFPERLPVRFDRVAPSAAVRELVVWWWVTQWQLPLGEESAQQVLAFPASNLVIEPDHVRLWGPTTRRSTRILQGSGWALGALLRPAAVPAVASDPGRLRDDSTEVAIPELHARVATAAAGELREAVPAVEQWLRRRVGALSADARLANRLAELASNDPSIESVAQLAEALGVSERTVHRLADRYVGLTPYSMIRRRRLQEAVAVAREAPTESLANVAARFGFTDQAHLAREARTVLGFSLRDYRRQLHS